MFHSRPTFNRWLSLDWQKCLHLVPLLSLCLCRSLCRNARPALAFVCLFVCSRFILSTFERERRICCLLHGLQRGLEPAAWVCALGVCPDWESHWRPFGYRVTLHPMSRVSHPVYFFIHLVIHQVFLEFLLCAKPYGSCLGQRRKQTSSERVESVPTQCASAPLTISVCPSARFRVLFFQVATFVTPSESSPRAALLAQQRQRQGAHFNPHPPAGAALSQRLTVGVKCSSLAPGQDRS